MSDLDQTPDENLPGDTPEPETPPEPVTPEVLPPEDDEPPELSESVHSVDAVLEAESAPIIAGELTSRDVERLYKKIENPSEMLSDDEMRAAATVSANNSAKIRTLLGTFMLDRLLRNRETGNAMSLAVQRLTTMIPNLDITNLTAAMRLLNDIDSAQVGQITSIVNGNVGKGAKEGDVVNNLVQILNVRQPEASSPEAPQHPLIDGKSPLSERLSKMDPDRLNRLLKLTESVIRETKPQE